MNWQEKLKDLIMSIGTGDGEGQVKVISIKDLDVILAEAEKEAQNNYFESPHEIYWRERRDFINELRKILKEIKKWSLMFIIFVSRYSFY